MFLFCGTFTLYLAFLTLPTWQLCGEIPPARPGIPSPPRPPSISPPSPAAENSSQEREKGKRHRPDDEGDPEKMMNSRASGRVGSGKENEEGGWGGRWIPVLS